MRKILASVLIVAALCACHREPEVQREFSSAIWKAGEDSVEPVRSEMVGNLLKTHRLNRFSRRQVLELLGPPTETDKYKDWDLVYVLGPDTTYMPIDHRWLLLKVEDDEVTKVLISED